MLDFQKEANTALNEERPDSQKLEKLVDFGVTLDVELPEIARLKQLLNQAKWLDEVGLGQCVRNTEGLSKYEH